MLAHPAPAVRPSRTIAGVIIDLISVQNYGALIKRLSIAAHVRRQFQNAILIFLQIERRYPAGVVELSGLPVDSLAQASQPDLLFCQHKKPPFSFYPFSIPNYCPPVHFCKKSCKIPANFFGKNHGKWVQFAGSFVIIGAERDTVGLWQEKTRDDTARLAQRSTCEILTKSRGM